MNGMNYQNTNDEQSFDLLDILAISSLILQLVDHNRTTRQMGNNDIMRGLQRQNKDYLKRILENQKEILSILSDMKSNMSAK